MRSRAFTLLEVMVAVAILGLALTVILSAQAGLYAASTHVQNETVAIGMVRCKMGEIEEELLRLGYPELDQIEDGACCEDQTPDKMRCSWKVERIELPNPPTFAEDNPAGDSASLDMSSPTGGAASPFGALLGGGNGPLPSAGVDGGLSSFGSMVGGDSSGGMAGIAPMVMSLVYPTFKPMLEASIRKVTVTVQWKEGINDRDLVVVQYVTNPMRGGFNMAMEGTDPEANGLGNLLGGGGLDTKSPSAAGTSAPIMRGGGR
jgi:general secretion pathway protein I